MTGSVPDLASTGGVVHQSWLTPDAAVAPAGAKGSGTFATQPIAAGTTVAGFGGNVVDRAEFDALDEEWRTHSLQIDDQLYLVSRRRSRRPTSSTTRVNRTAGSSARACW